MVSRNLRGNPVSQEFEEAFEAEARRLHDNDEVFDLRNALRDANERLRKAKVTSETVAIAAFEGAKSAVLAQERSAVQPYKSPKSTKSDAKAEVALWHLTDWQGAKKTISYDSEVMIERAHRFVDKALKITDIQRHDHPVKEATILLGGDMIEGLFNFPTQPYEIDATLFDQFVNVADLLDQVMRRASAHYDSVKVVAEWGNHGRLGSKRDAVPRSDNADRMTYQLASVMGRDLKNVEWSIVADDIQRFEIGNYRALLIHGDEIGRSGYASPPTIANHVAKWKSGSYRVDGVPWAFRDCYVGHYHQHQQHPTPDGEGAVFFTGSTESDNRYARDSMAASAVPSQRLHFIDPRKGRVTAQYQVALDA